MGKKGPAADGPDLCVEVLRSPREVILRVRGELDLTCADRLRTTIHDALLAGSTPRLVLDLGGLRFMDAAGIHVILDARKRATAARAELVLLRPTRIVRRVLRLTGVDEAVRIEASLPTL